MVCTSTCTRLVSDDQRHRVRMMPLRRLHDVAEVRCIEQPRRSVGVNEQVAGDLTWLQRRERSPLLLSQAVGDHVSLWSARGRWSAGTCRRAG